MDISQYVLNVQVVVMSRKGQQSEQLLSSLSWLMVVSESEAHWRVFDRLNKGNDYRMVVTASCEDRSGRRRLKTRKKRFVIMTWMRFLVVFKKNDSDS
jgi:hypothetical protein